MPSQKLAFSWKRLVQLLIGATALAATTVSAQTMVFNPDLQLQNTPSYQLKMRDENGKPKPLTAEGKRLSAAFSKKQLEILNKHKYNPVVALHESALASIDQCKDLKSSYTAMTDEDVKECQAYSVAYAEQVKNLPLESAAHTVKVLRVSIDLSLGRISAKKAQERINALMSGSY